MMGIPAASAMLSTSVSFQSSFAGDLNNPKFRAKTAEAIMFLRCVREDDLYQGLEKTVMGMKFPFNVEDDYDAERVKQFGTTENIKEAEL